MAFEESLKNSIDTYVNGHLASRDWHLERFDFIRDVELKERLADEFISARYIYKLLEGMAADGWLLRAQIRIQVLSYASIYEAVLHHLLFEIGKSLPEVKKLREYKANKKISIPAEKLKKLAKILEHDSKKIIPTYEGIAKNDETKVRFDEKAKCAHKLGLVSESIRDDIIEFYEARNAIHIHAEIRKDLNYEIQLSRKAYFRMEPFIEGLKNTIISYERRVHNHEKKILIQNTKKYTYISQNQRKFTIIDKS
ncbi:hypothetical protein QXB69_002569 [Vibrio fluvialis]|nr:hypothetical protein [Vibrio fluvialis]ELO1774501.1 hypothetical protein [Vibrio fluvialis]